MSKELLPCPFCGGINIDASFSRGYKNGEYDKNMIAAGCMDCGSVGPTVVLRSSGPGYKESAEAWNRRTTPLIPSDKRHFVMLRGDKGCAKA